MFVIFHDLIILDMSVLASLRPYGMVWELYLASAVDKGYKTHRGPEPTHPSQNIPIADLKNKKWNKP